MMQQFEKESTKMEMSGEMMDDVLDDVLGKKKLGVWSSSKPPYTWPFIYITDVLSVVLGILPPEDPSKTLTAPGVLRALISSSVI